ncbi:MAG: hypothetical protein FWD77_01545 [Betaproteobacteria bacterium]|nr:hypothetical protein [Betaproteobacteria bacterium]
MIEQMRADFLTLAAWLKASEGWSEAEVEEMRAAVQEAVERGDEALMACWAAWLAERSAQAKALRERVIAFEKNVHAQTEQKKREFA